MLLRRQASYIRVHFVSKMACAALKRPHNFDLLGGSPDHKASASPKRRRCGVVASTCSSTSVSPFLEATPKLSKDELAKNVQDEWRRIQRRRKLTCPSSPPNNTSNLQNLFCGSPSSSFTWSSPPRGSMSPCNSSSMSPPRNSGDRTEQTSLNVKQVVSLCERLWKEREDKLREEYDKVLNDRLSEQYDSFLKFTQDQIMRKYQTSSCSYVS